MDSNQPIAVVSMGATRTVEFLHNYQATTQTPVKSLGVQDNSLYVMKPKCQEYFRHRVPSSKEPTADRFSLSFRRIITKDAAPIAADSVGLSSSAPVAVSAAPIRHAPIRTDMGTSPVNPQKLQHLPRVSRPTPASPNDRKITLLLGTSMTYWVKPDLLSDEHSEFINISHRGARIENRSPGGRIPDFGEMIENFSTTNADKIPRVEQVILNLGTNDLRHYRVDNGRGRRATPGDVSKFYHPIINLIKRLRHHFGAKVRICFISVLPMKNMYTYTATNFLNFNQQLQSICSEMECCYLDWFPYFVDSEGYDFNKKLYSDPVHLNRDGYELLHKGLKYAVDVDGYFYSECEVS
jgi:hypothetical protein